MRSLAGLLAAPAVLRSLFHASQVAYVTDEALVAKAGCGESCDEAPWASGDARLVQYPADSGASATYQAIVGRARRLRDAPSDTCVAAFRGTSNMRDWWTDLDAFPLAAPVAWHLPNCSVHRGFLSALQALGDDVSGALRACKSVIFTGHSLGGAMALLGAVGNVSSRPTRAVVTFSAPRALATSCHAGLPPLDLLRVTSGRDPVPHLPPHALGYRHAGPELFFDANAQPRTCTAENATECSGRYADPLLWRPREHCVYHGPLFAKADICTPTLRHAPGDDIWFV